jgi:hypothetical protein
MNSRGQKFPMIEFIYDSPCKNDKNCKLFTCERGSNCTHFNSNKYDYFRWIYNFQTIEKPIMDKKIKEQLVFILMLDKKIKEQLVYIKILFALVVISFILILALAIALVTKK